VCAYLQQPIAFRWVTIPIWLYFDDIDIEICRCKTRPIGFCLFYLKGIAPPGIYHVGYLQIHLAFVLLKLLVLIIVH